MDTNYSNYLTLFELCSIHLIRAFLCPYLYEHNQTMLKNIKTNQLIKETMQIEEIKNFKMNDDVYSQRKKVIDILYQAFAILQGFPNFDDISSHFSLCGKL